MSDALVSEIYDCALMPELWPSVLEKLAVAAEATGCVLFQTQEGGPSPRWFTTSPAVLDRATAYFAEGWFFKDRRRQGILDDPPYGFVTEGHYRSEQELFEDETIRGFHARWGTGRVAGTLIDGLDSERYWFSAEREFAGGPTGRHIVARMNALRPHLARSLLMAGRLHKQRARLMGQALALMGVPALVFDQHARVLAANDLVESMAAHFIWRAHDAMALRDRRADAQLRDALGLLGMDDAPSVRTFVARNQEGLAEIICHVIPVRGVAHDIFARGMGVLVLAPITGAGAIPADLLRSLFDLSPAEARVARRLVDGDTVETIATSHGVSGNTVRTQVRGVLEKTGCCRQAEVVALLSRIAVPRVASDVART